VQSSRIALEHQQGCNKGVKLMRDDGENGNSVSRRRVLQGGVGVGAVVLGVATTASAQVAKKASHASAGYQETANAGKSCGTCRQFQAPSSCVTVESPISSGGWCRLYAKKA
jgi:hypothetical protein